MLLANTYPGTLGSAHWPEEEFHTSEMAGEEDNLQVLSWLEGDE